jgi:hypothetical protein
VCSRQLRDSRYSWRWTSGSGTPLSSEMWLEPDSGTWDPVLPYHETAFSAVFDAKNRLSQRWVREASNRQQLKKSPSWPFHICSVRTSMVQYTPRWAAFSPFVDISSEPQLSLGRLKLPKRNHRRNTSASAISKQHSTAIRSPVSHR